MGPHRIQGDKNMWWMKKFRKRKTQSLLIFLVIALCTTLIAGSCVILTSLTSGYQQLAEETDAPDVKVYSRPGFENDYQSMLEQCESVEKVVPIITQDVTTVKTNGLKQDVFMDVVAYEPEVYGKVRMISGSLDDLKEGTCILAKASASNLELSVGDTITIPMDGTDYDYEVVGLYAEIYSVATEYTCDVLVTELPKDVPQSKVYATWLKDGVTCDELIQEYTEDNEGILNGYFRSSADSVVNAELTELILGGILLGISSVVFLAILLILGYIVKNSFATDKNTIAIYKTMGYTDGRIKRLYVTFYMSIIIAGALVGGCCSPILSNAFIKDVYQNIGMKEAIGGFPQIMICTVGICFIAFLMLTGEARRIVKFKPVEILTNAEQKSKRKVKQAKSTQRSFSPLAMALRMMRRDKKNTALLVLTCFVSLYIVNLSVVCLQNVDLIRNDNNYYWLGIDKHDISIESMTTKEEFYDICDEIAKDSEVEHIARHDYDMGLVIPYHQVTTALVFDTYEGVDMSVLEGHNPKKNDEIVVSNVYLKELGVEIGDYITLQLDAEHKKDLLIVGTYQGFYNMGRGVKVLGGLFEEEGIDFAYNGCSVTLNQKDDMKSYIEKLEKKYDGKIKVVERKHLFENIMATVCDPQKTALMPFTVITALIGALNAFYIIYASNKEKRKKFMIYKSLGYTSSHLITMNCLYVGIIVVLSAIVAVPVFITVFPKIMVIAMGSFGFAEYNMTVKPVTVLVTNLAMLGIFLLSAYGSATEIRKNHIAKIMSE